AYARRARGTALDDLQNAERFGVDFLGFEALRLPHAVKPHRFLERSGDLLAVLVPDVRVEVLLGFLDIRKLLLEFIEFGGPIQDRVVPYPAHDALSCGEVRLRRSARMKARTLASVSGQMRPPERRRSTSLPLLVASIPKRCSPISASARKSSIS